MPDHVHLLVACHPQFGIHRPVKQIKGRSSHVLRAEFLTLESRLPTRWTNSYFVAILGGATSEVVKRYVENQKNAQLRFLPTAEAGGFLGALSMKAAEWDARYVQSDLVWGAPPNNTVVEFVHGLDRRVPRLPGPDGEIPDLPRALDLACGEGRNALWLATHGWRVHGIDFSQVGIDKGRTVATRLTRSIRERITWQCTDLTDPALDLGGPWELILLVFLHLPAPERRRLLRQAAGALAPGGMLLVLGHHSENPARGYGGPQDPAILFTPEDVVADLGADSGLDIDTAREVLRPTEGGDAIDALVVARKPMPEQ